MAAADGIERIHEAARTYLAAAISELAERSSTVGNVEEDQVAWVASRWVNDLASAQRDDLSAAIRAANPERFASAHAEARRYAATYPPALLRAVIARSRVEHVSPSADSSIATRLIQELGERVMVPIWVWRTVNIVADLDATDVDGRDVHGITLHAVPQTAATHMGWHRVLSPLMPEAVQELWEQDVFSVTGRVRTSLLTVTDERSIPEHEYFRDPADARLGRFLAALRLATGATVDVTAVCRGEPFDVHQDPPVVQGGEWEGYLGGWHRRPLALTDELSNGIDRLATLMDAGLSDPLAIAISRYTRSHLPALWMDRVVDLAVAVDAALIGEKMPEEITLRICSRAAHLLATENDRASLIFDDVKDLYELRSEVVHGGSRSEKIWNRFTDRHGFTETLALDRLAPAFDRMRG